MIFFKSSNLVFISISLTMLLSLPVKAQKTEIYRSDTLSSSVQMRYLFLSFGAGVEFPFRQHSFGLQVGQNYVPYEGNFYIGFDDIKVIAAEYKRYWPQRSGSPNQYYYGSYLLLRHINHESPEEVVGEGYWYKSKSVGLGPMVGVKSYIERSAYVEFFLGLHGGWQWGDLRWDNEDPGTGKSYPIYEKASKGVIGIRLGISLGVHL